ncbi:MAG: hypothetical protein ACOH5I_16395 [Oligoflexus sp.]
MLENWSHCLDRLPLSANEQELVKKFQEQPQGRSFLAVAELLLKYGMRDDGIQLLLHGIQLHPGYSVARVVLIAELFQQGMPEEAWQILENSPNSLRDNKTAQILKFKLALILGHDDLMPVLRQEMFQRDQFDSETTHLADQLAIEDFASVRHQYLNQLRARGIPLPLDFLELAKQISERIVKRNNKAEDAEAHAHKLENSLSAKRRIDGFFVTPLQQIFTKPLQPLAGLAKKDMDAMTLAQVYRRQGHYQKSLEILKRLLYMAPSNDLLRKQVAEVRSLKEDQERRERDFDPDLADRMEEARRLDQKIQGLALLLEELDQYDAKKEI